MRDHHEHGGRGPFRGMRGEGAGRGGSRRRPFDQGDLRLLVLDLVATQPRHGYEIIKAIEDALGGHYSPSPGVIYPTLTLLEETGLVSSQSIGAKKLYSLTAEGRAQLDLEAHALQAARARMDEAARTYGGAPPPEVVRAMHNLRTALQLRLAKGALSSAQLQAVTAAIDGAAPDVERS